MKGRRWLQPWAITPGELDLCMIEARPTAKTGSWKFRCKRVWEGGWAPLDSSLELVRKADCDEPEFEARFPDCILAVPVANGNKVVALGVCA